MNYRSTSVNRFGNLSRFRYGDRISQSPVSLLSTSTSPRMTHITTPSCRMPLEFFVISVQALLAKFDLWKGFLQFPIRQSDRWKLGFEWKGKVYRYTRLPFGLTVSPGCFCWITESIALMMRVRGIRVM